MRFVKLTASYGLQAPPERERDLNVTALSLPKEDLGQTPAVLEKGNSPESWRKQSCGT
jgi:hypothetical protein